MLATGQVTATTTAQPLTQCTTPGSLSISNTGAVVVYYGPGPGLTAANGFPIPAGQVSNLAEVGNSGPIYVVAASATAVVGFAYGTRA